jgi:hypothetical protein
MFIVDQVVAYIYYYFYDLISTIKLISIIWMLITIVNSRNTSLIPNTLTYDTNCAHSHIFMII